MLQSSLQKFLVQKKSSVAKGLRFRDYLVAFVRRICFNARVSFLRIYVSRLCEYFSYIFHIFHESPWTITSRSRTLENIRIHRKTCKIRKKYSRFLFVQYSRKNPRLSSQGRISLHRSLPSKRRFIKPEERDCIWRRATDITRVAENWTWLAFQVIRIFGSSSLFNVATKLARTAFQTSFSIFGCRSKS